MLTEFLVLIPPVLVLTIAFLTKNIKASLIVGIFTAASILNSFYIGDTLKTIFERLIKVTEIQNITSLESFCDSNKLFIFLFLIALGIIISVLEHSGSAFAYGNFVKQRLQSSKSAESSSLLLSTFFFIDDYFSSLTVGSVMQPVTDRFAIPRVKLGLLVNAIAVPTAILIPISSWVATILGQLRQIGIASNPDEKTVIICDPFFAYLNTIPFLFYALIIVASLWFIVLRRISYGVLAKHEHVAQTTGTLFGGKSAVVRNKQTSQVENHSTLFDFAFPIILLIVLSIFEILRGGEFFLFGGNNSLIEVLAFSNIPAALFKASLASVLLTTIYFLIRKTIKFADVPKSFLDGTQMMLPSILTLILIWTFSGILSNDLQIGNFIAQNLVGSISVSFLPLIFFATAVAMALLIGSAWGTFGLLIPIGVPMLLTLSKVVTPVTITEIPMLFPLLGAIISGAVAGTQMSPISDVMLMSATSSGCYHIDLVKVQTSFAIPSIISAATAFLLAGLLIQLQYGLAVAFASSIFIGIVLNFIILSGLNILLRYRKKH